MQYPVTQISPLVKFRRTRVLPVPGTVLVRVGQKVAPADILAESQVPSRHIQIDVFRALGLKNPADTDKLIDRNVGDLVEKHDVIAETGGMFSRVIRAPMAGKVVSIKNGQVLLEVESRKVVLQSGLSGQVVEVLNDRGAVLESSGTLIQGVWGNGLIGYGPLVSDVMGMSQELTTKLLDITARGAVVAAAWCEQEESLSAAALLPLGGLILGSLHPRLIPFALQQPFPIILLEGFGKTGINEIAKKVLVESAQREISLNAVKWDHLNGLRPEISIAFTGDTVQASESAELNAGQKVRIHSAPYAGQTGVLTAINKAKTTLPNGLRTATASIMLQNNEKAVVPLANFEIIENAGRIPG